MRDAPSRAACFVVLGGPLGGTRLLLDQAVDEVSVGSDASCRLCLDLPGVSPIHARLRKDAAGLSVHDTRSPRGVYVNDDRVVERTAVREGDVVWLGPPGAPESVMLQCRGVEAGQTEVSPPPGEEVFFIDDVPPPTGPAPTVDPLGPALADPASLLLDDVEEFFLDDTSPASVAADGRAVTVGPDEVRFSLVVPPEPATRPAPAAAPPTEDEDVFVVEDHTPVAVSRPSQPPRPSQPSAPAPARPEIRPAGLRPGPVARAGGVPSRPGAPRTAGASGVSPRPDRAARARTGPARPSSRYALVAAGALVLAAGGFLGLRLFSGPELRAASPPRVGNGLSVVLQGRGFSATPGENTVRFADGRPGRVVRAAANRLEVELPELDVPPSGDLRVPVVVEVGGRASAPLEIAVHQTPRIHGVSPSVAMPGEEVLLAGAGWSLGATVRFGDLDAQVLDTTPREIRVRVPDIQGPPGTSAPVVVSISGQVSSPAPFLVGRLPLVTGVEPGRAAPGDVVKVHGRGFHVDPARNVVRIGPAAALVLSAGEGQLELIVPWGAPAGHVRVEVRVSGSVRVGEASLSVAAPPDPAELRFAAEPFDDVPGHDHAVLATAVGPAFVLSASGGKSAAQRALDAQRRLNQGATVLRASRAADIEVRGIGSDPIVGLAGSTEALLSVTAEDASGYDEDWTKRGRRGGPVTRDRLAAWWTAVGRDLVLLLVRSERPRHAAALAAEGRVLADVFQAARRAAPYGVPREVASRPAHREALRSVAFRVPASVAASGPGAGSQTPAASSVAAGPAAPAAALKLDGVWVGTEQEGGRRKYVTMKFRGDAGSYSIDGAVSVTTPFTAVERPQRNAVRFTLEIGGGLRYLVGRWDGSRIVGKVTEDPEGAVEIATFEMSPGR